MRENKNLIAIMAIIAVVLVVLITWVKYQYFGENLPSFSLMGIASKAVLLILLFILGWMIIKREEGIASVKMLFQGMFILILVGESAMLITDYLCLHHFYPNFIDDFHAKNQVWLANESNWPEERKEQALGDILAMKEVGISDTIQILLRSIIISSIFAFIFAFIIITVNRKNRELKERLNGQSIDR